MFPFQTGNKTGTTATSTYYAQVSSTLPVAKIRESYVKLSAEYRKLGWYDRTVGTGFFAFQFGVGGSEPRANDAWKVAKTGQHDPSLPIKAGGEAVPKAVADLDRSKQDFDRAYLAFMGADKKFSMNPENPKLGQDCLVSYSRYVQALYDLHSRVQHFDQSGIKGVANGINFALDAATLPLLLVGAGGAAAGVKVVAQQGFKTAAKLALKSMPQAAAYSAGYAALATSGDFFAMNDQKKAAENFKKDAGAATDELRREVYRLKKGADGAGDAELAGQLQGLYGKLLKLSMDIADRRIDVGELAAGFATYFAMGMALSSAFSIGAAARKIAKYGAEGLRGRDLEIYLNISEAVGGKNVAKLKSAFGINGELTPESLKKQHNALAKQYHPDKGIGEPDIAVRGRMTAKINQARDILAKQMKAGGEQTVPSAPAQLPGKTMSAPAEKQAQVAEKTSKPIENAQLPVPASATLQTQPAIAWMAPAQRAGTGRAARTNPVPTAVKPAKEAAPADKTSASRLMMSTGQVQKPETELAAPLQIRREFIKAGNAKLADFLNNEVKVSGIPAEKLGRFAELAQKYELRYPTLAPDEKRPEPSLGGLMESYEKWAGKNNGKDIVEFMEALEKTRLPHRVVCRMEEINSAIQKHFGTELGMGTPSDAFEGTAAVYKVVCEDGTRLMVKLANVSVEVVAVDVFARLGFDPRYKIMDCGEFGLMTVAPGMTVKELFKVEQYRSLRLSDIDAGGDAVKRANFLTSMAEWQAVQWACRLGDSHPRNYMIDETGVSRRIDYDKTGRDDPNFLSMIDMQFDFGFGRGTASKEDFSLFENAFKDAWSRMQQRFAKDAGLQDVCRKHAEASNGQFPDDFYQMLKGNMGRNANDVWQEFSASTAERMRR